MNCSSSGTLTTMSHIHCRGRTGELRRRFGINLLYDLFYRVMSLQLTTMWTNFAKTGDPNLPTSPNIGCSWSRQTAANKQWASVYIYLLPTTTFYLYVGISGLVLMASFPWSWDQTTSEGLTCGRRSWTPSTTPLVSTDNSTTLSKITF